MKLVVRSPLCLRKAFDSERMSLDREDWRSKIKEKQIEFGTSPVPRGRNKSQIYFSLIREAASLVGADNLQSAFL